MNSDDRGSTIPLILGFFLIALMMVAASVTFGQVFVQQRDLQDVCDGAATAAAASSADLDRGTSIASGDSLRFADVQHEVERYLERDPSRAGVQVAASLSADHELVSVRCTQFRTLAFGRFFGHEQLRHTTRSSARAAVS